MSFPCPACGTNAHVRTSRPLSTAVSEQYLHCVNPMCECVFKTLIEVNVIVGESRLPESEVPPDYLKLRVSKNSKGNSKIAGLPANWARNTPSGKRWAAIRKKKEDADHK